MTVLGTPTLPELKAWLGLDEADTADDTVLSESLNASIQSQCLVVCYPRDSFGDQVFTPDLREAVFLRSQRLAARRNSPEGVVGLTGTDGDFVGARVPSYDTDVWRLEGPHLKIPVA